MCFLCQDNYLFGHFNVTVLLHHQRLLLLPINISQESFSFYICRRSLNPEFVSVQPIGSKPGRECSTRAVVTAVSTHPSQKTTVVYAEEEGDVQAQAICLVLFLLTLAYYSYHVLLEAQVILQSIIY